MQQRTGTIDIPTLGGIKESVPDVAMLATQIANRREIENKITRNNANRGKAICEFAW